VLEEDVRAGDGNLRVTGAGGRVEGGKQLGAQNDFMAALGLRRALSSNDG